MADLIETYRGTVYPWHCDHMGHMNVMWYVGKFDEATWVFFANLGLAPSFLRQHRLGMAAVEQRIAYRRELHAGDTVHVRTGVLEVRPKALRFVHEMSAIESGEVAAITELVAVHLDTAARKARELPDVAVQRAHDSLVEYRLPW